MAKVSVTPEYSNYLDSIEWTHWCTFTTRYDLSMKSARRMSETIFNHLGNKNDLFARIDKMFWVAEPFDVKDGFHIHALVQTNLDSKEIYEWTKKRYGRSLVLPYEKEKGAHSYVAKYITKSLSDYDILFR